MYTLETCSNYNLEEIKGINVVVFDKHNHALPVWGTYANKNKCPFKLITFDYHTDTRPPFCKKVQTDFLAPENYRESKEIRDLLRSRPRYSRCDFNFEDVFVITESVENDEHIKTAADFGYLDSYTVICKDDIQDCQENDISEGYTNAVYHQIDWLLKAKQSELLELLSSSPTILDFDLDFFNAKNEIDSYLEIISPLVRKARLITIAREAKYFEECRNNNDFCNKDAEKLLIAALRNIIV